MHKHTFIYGKISCGKTILADALKVATEKRLGRAAHVIDDGLHRTTPAAVLRLAKGHDLIVTGETRKDACEYGIKFSYFISIKQD